MDYSPKPLYQFSSNHIPVTSARILAPATTYPYPFTSSTMPTTQSMLTQEEPLRVEDVSPPDLQHAHTVRGVGNLSLHLATGKTAKHYKELIVRAHLAGMDTPIAISPASAKMLGTQTHKLVGFTRMHDAVAVWAPVRSKSKPHLPPHQVLLNVLRSADLNSGFIDQNAPVANWVIHTPHAHQRKVRAGFLYLTPPH